MSRIALRFISGKYKGGEYILPEKKETYIGRSSDIDLVLMEDMVSRKHARIWIEDEKIHLEDFGSTNGTFVNGEKISKTSVNQGDRILIGTSIMKVIETDNIPRRTRVSGVETVARQAASRTQQGSRSMSGTISEVPLPDLTQLFSTSKKTGTLVIDKDGVIGKIHLKNGRLIYASISDSPDLPPLKAIFRILSWNSGNFELRGPEQEDFREIVDMPTEHILMEGLRQLDEIRHINDRLPSVDSELVVITPLLSRLADLSPEELDVFQLVYNYGTVREILDRAPSTDVNTANTIVSLIKRSYVAQV